MNDLFDFISCCMSKSESNVVFEMFFDNLTTGMILEIFNDNFNIFRVYLTIMFVPLK